MWVFQNRMLASVSLRSVKQSRGVMGTEKIFKSYVVWYWDSICMNFRVGKVFKCKEAAEAFADSLKHWQYIGITYSAKIYNFAY